VTGDPEIVSGFDLTAISGTTIAANNTVTVTLTFVSPALPGQGASYTTGNITATHAVVFGPIPNIWANSSGLVTVTITGTVTGMTFAAYLAPQPSGAKHNPFEMADANAADY
jgi:hypothetical protein